MTLDKWQWGGVGGQGNVMGRVHCRGRVQKVTHTQKKNIFNIQSHQVSEVVHSSQN